MPRVYFSFLLMFVCVLTVACRPDHSGNGSEGTDADASIGTSAEQSLDRLKELGAKLEYHKNGNLKSINLVGVEVDDAALDGWGQFKTLESVTIASHDKPNDQVTDATIAQLSGLVSLKSLDLSGTAATGNVLPKLQNMKALALLKMSGKLSGEGLKSLGTQFPALRSVAFDRSDIGDDDLAEIAKAKRLVGLFLAHTNVTDQGMTHLARLTSLQNLRLSNTALSDEGLKSLASLKALTSLDLSNTKVGNDGMAILANMSQLERLNLYMTQVTDAGIDSLLPLANLNWLNIDACRIGDVSVPKLATLKKLTYLHLGSTDVSDACIETLKTMPYVKELHLTRTNITRPGAESLISVLPHDCNVYVDKVDH